MVAARNSTVFFSLFFLLYLRHRGVTRPIATRVSQARGLLSRWIYKWKREIDESKPRRRFDALLSRRRSVAIIFEWGDIAVAWPIADRAPVWLQPIVEDALAASLAGLRSCLREGACALFLGMVYQRDDVSARRTQGGSSSSRVRLWDPITPATRALMQWNGSDRCLNISIFFLIW